MNTKHTPGPWRHHLGRGSNPRFHIQNQGGYQIASTVTLVMHRLAVEENTQREANARLIAAAPELLEALQGMVDSYGQAACECIDPHVPGHCPCCIARAVIAKAKGTP